LTRPATDGDPATHQDALVPGHVEFKYEEQLHFERLVRGLSTAFVSLAPDEVDPSINGALEAVGRFMRADRAFVAQFSPDKRTFRSTHLWLAEGIPHDPRASEMVLSEEAKWMTQRMLQGVPCIFTSLDEIPEEAANERAYASASGIRSSCILPLKVGGEVIGNFGFDMIRNSRQWSEDDITRARTMSQLVANALQRQRQHVEIQSLTRSLEAENSFERFVRGLSTTFVTNAPDEIDHSIYGALEAFGRFVQADRALLMQFSPDQRTLRTTHLWSDEGIPHDQLLLDMLLNEDLPYLTRIVREVERPIIFATLDDVPEEAVKELEYARAAGVKSLCIIPIEIGGEVIGAFGVDTIRTPRQWSDEDTSRTRTVSELLASGLQRQRQHAEIQRLTQRLEAENIYLREAIDQELDADQIIGESAAISNVLRQIEMVASTDSTVLLTGETGTGKELVARAIHRRSRRADRPLVKVDCAALPETLIESALFGHVKGAYTGAFATKAGRFELADGGTIFLDEIGEMPPPLQAKLLRVLQEGEFERVGSTDTLNVDVRVVAATNRNIERAVADETFRQDLFYRLNVFPIEVPPLRHRREDVPLLVWRIINGQQTRFGKRIEAIDPEVMASLIAYDWPGNVRELQNVIERALIRSPGPNLQLDDAFISSSVQDAPPPPDRSESGAALRLVDLERNHIIGVLEECGWKIKGPGNAAERLGLPPSTLRFRMKKLGIERPAASKASD
jgi:transcriptional regulator with GAF, ATPase, and Fis domain